MGFNEVYQTLKDLFPKVDGRLLKAVAIEHSKDPEVAVEAVLAEVLPFVSGKSIASSAAVVENKEKMMDVYAESSLMLGSAAGEDANGICLVNGSHNFDDDSLGLTFYDANDSDDQLSGATKNEELTAAEKYQETSINFDLCEKSTSGSLIGQCRKDNCNQFVEDHVGISPVTLQKGEIVSQTTDALQSFVSDEDGEAEVSLIEGNVQRLYGNCNRSSLYDPKQAAPLDSFEEQPSIDCNSFECLISQDQTFLSELSGWRLDQEADSGTSVAHDNNQAKSSSADADFTREFSDTDANDTSGETVLNSIVTRSGQVCRVKLLEDIIEETKNYKDTVFNVMESVLSLMAEVELQEKEAEQAKVAAEKGGLDILEKVEEIKEMLKHAKEANDMHAGEVYGEKSILGTEVKELQSRLFVLSDEKDKSLSILEEMRSSLEDRLAVAEEQKRAAEQEMFEKEETARHALAEQEAIMDKVVQESKLLQEEAEENSKLRDFLMEKGQVVDMLQGEIAVICQDVKSMKENFDSRVSLSKSLSIEQTSCRLASTSSSIRSMGSLRSNVSLKRTASVRSTVSSKTIASETTTEHIELPESPARMSLANSFDSQTPTSNVAEKIISEAVPQKQHLDDDWELCDLD